MTLQPLRLRSRDFTCYFASSELEGGAFSSTISSHIMSALACGLPGYTKALSSSTVGRQPPLPPSILDPRQVGRGCCTLPTVTATCILPSVGWLSNVSVLNSSRRPGEPGHAWVVAPASLGICSPGGGQGCCPEPSSFTTHWINNLYWLFTKKSMSFSLH